jgi:hypothetical protein
MLFREKPKRLFLLIFILAAALTIPYTGVSAAEPVRFVALGDSTGFGLSAFPDPFDRNLESLYGFNDMFAESLGIYGTSSYINLAWPGDKTSDLLYKLGQTGSAAAVRGADMLTVTIGGNNLLGPSIAAICGIWGIDPANYPGDLDGRDMLTALAEAIAYRYMTVPGYDPMVDFMRLFTPDDPAAVAFHMALAQGIADFNVEWPAIARQIRRLNPKAELYVNTVHNPIRITGPDDPLLSLYLQFEFMIDSLNRTIESYSRMYRYQVVDINQAFKDTSGSLTFDIAGAINTATAIFALGPAPDPYQYAALVLQLLQKTDPHPTYVGHQAAFALLQSVRDCRKPAKPVWPAMSPNSPRSAWSMP